MKKDYFALDVSLFLLSAAVIGFQLTLMQILSIQQWSHMASMVISIALLGFGASGTLLAILKKYLLKQFDKYYTTLLLLSAITMVLSPILTGSSWLQFDTYLIFINSGHIFRLIMTCLLYFIPFVLAALAIGMSFTYQADRIGRLYFANLLGSGAGAIITVLFMWKIMPQHLPLINASFTLVGALFFYLLKPQNSTCKLLFTLTFCVCIMSFYIAPDIQPSEYKSWSKAIRLPQAKIQTVQNSPYGLVQTISSSAIRYAPSVSLTNTETIPQAGLAFVNGESVGYFPTDSTNKLFPLLQCTPVALAYQLKHRKSTLILQSGMGEQIHLALLKNSKQITTTEVNPVLHSLTKSFLNNTKYNSQILFNNSSARSFLKQDSTTFDAILFPAIGSFYGSSGLYALQEQNWLTIEAFMEARDHLTNDGILCVPCWLDYPYRSPLKLIATLDEVIKNQNIDTTETYLIGVKNWNQITFFMKRTPFSDEEISQTTEFCDSLLFDPLIFNNSLLVDVNPIHTTADTLFNHYNKQLTSAQKGKFYPTYPFRVKPATDNKPYFFHFLKPAGLNKLINDFNIAGIPYFELGYLLALITFLFIVVFGVSFIILPLKIVNQLKIKPSVFNYFAAIGIAYMITEMVLIHQFNIYFDNPVYAVAIIIGILLISSGIGSYISEKIRTKNSLWIAPLLIAFIIGIYLICLPYFINITMAFTLSYKIIFSLVTIGCLGFVMGLPFPLAIKQLSIENKDTIPSAWATNGFFSVAATPLAILLSIEIGFSGLFIIGACSYLLASFSIFSATS
ncbi:hypothetical protein E9993_16770 [Labilibacter sediminis]|nr:hypothetical protein E9993_16770 [Labilibacter sediminis]